MSVTVQELLDNKEKFDQYAQEAFNSYDKDHSGKIDSKELANVMNKFNEVVYGGAITPTQEDIDSFLKELDTNKSGNLDLNEFKVVLRLFLDNGAKA